MLEIKCPNCGEKIKIGKDEYNSLLNDIEKEEIEKRVEERIRLVEKTYKANLESINSKATSEKDTLELKYKHEIELLKEKLSNQDKDREIAVNEAITKYRDAYTKKSEELLKLEGDVKSLQKESDLNAQKMKEYYEFLINAKDEEINKWKNFQLGDSTKDLGESLEKYCRDSFEEIRAVAYPNAYFEKDNINDEDGKGDFIFRDYKDGIEFVSIMFEMKNQKDTTKTKHKNEEFFAKLDKNRNNKNCEYAVLVSTLEDDSKLYNKGIVDVSHKFPKMFVVRPQYFLSIIGLIRNISTNTFEYKKQVIEYQKENLDITNFEDAVKAVTDKIINDYESANKVYEKVDKMCDDIISNVEKFRKEFKKATNYMEKAKNQLPNLEVRKLTKNNETMKEKFSELENNK